MVGNQQQSESRRTLPGAQKNLDPSDRSEGGDFRELELRWRPYLFAAWPRPMTSICPKCGTGLNDGATYCSACGINVSSYKGQTYAKQFSVNADDLSKKVRELIHEGNVTRIVVKDDKGVTLLEIPATVGVVGVLLAPWLAALGVIAALFTHCTLVVVRNVAPAIPA
jgi:hypothetical protein